MAKSKLKTKKKSSVKNLLAEAVVDETTPSLAPVVDYNQPLTSPYMRLIELRTGVQCYHIPANYLEIYPKLQPGPFWPESRLFDVDEDTGHTLVHFLYTGGYETLQAPSNGSTQSIPLEFERAVQVYHAAHTYEIQGLEALAKTYIERLGDAVSIFTILQAVRKVHARLPSDETWLHDYLHAKLQGAFDDDENTFTRDEFYQGLGDDHVFNQRVMKMVVNIYASAVSSLRARAAEHSQVEPSPDPHVGPDYPPTPRQSSLETVAENPPVGPVEADEVPVETCVDDGW